MREVLNHLFEHKTLNRAEAELILTNIAQGGYSESEIAAFLTVYLMRSITVDEISGFRDALLNLRISVDLSDFDPIDVCGTGGDGKDTFNISTISAFVLAGAGINVAKHGNYGVSSICGSSNILEYFGYRFSNSQDKLKMELEKSGICFLHAPLFNPAMKNVVPVRRALKVKTFFNMLGPMVNPSQPKKQLIGVYNLEIARLYNYLYQQSDTSYGIVFSLDGYDEVSLTSDFKYILNGVENIVSPESMNYKRIKQSQLKGGKTIQESAELFIEILSGQGNEAQNNVVTANAQIAIKCCYPELSLDVCRAMAYESLITGKGHKSFTRLIEIQK